eukprot:CAMPEP_0184326684 /NCGR_PEP_ID=MMETSP1049-20130417/142691_1 /TAXON_ID=77928 /ORGANISM="Proteomonas sulcata, Strain CCMP704" /LENGTH=92 /DNA_ID=CAMNT_0026648887 /DNA_START=1428 /DNA_END=1705 /DNA_ORIENTATION=+
MITSINAIRALEPSPTLEELNHSDSTGKELKEEGTVGSTSKRILYEMTKGHQKIPTFHEYNAQIQVLNRITGSDDIVADPTNFSQPKRMGNP